LPDIASGKLVSAHYFAKVRLSIYTNWATTSLGLMDMTMNGIEQAIEAFQPVHFEEFGGWVADNPPNSKPGNLDDLIYLAGYIEIGQFIIQLN
jgi:hypothetical protein